MQQDRNRVIDFICHHEIGLAVAVKVPDRDDEWRRSDGEDERRLERSVTVSQVDKDGVVALAAAGDDGQLAGDRQVGLPVAIEVANEYPPVRAPWRESRRGAKGSVPITQQDRHGNGVQVMRYD